MSNPEIALFIEKEHLKDAEESDYMLMENLIQRRYDDDDDDEDDVYGDEGGEGKPSLLSVVRESKEYYNRSLGGSMGRTLRRASAIEADILPPMGE